MFIYKASYYGHIEIVEELLLKKANTEATSTHKFSNGWTPLICGL